jgi:DNA-binding LacI/PurR family transcriptional regulator
MPAIKDVARLAGLSVAVVSKYLKNHDSVRPDTLQRVEAAIAELGYRPSPFARSLRTGRSGMFSVVVPDITNPFFAELFQSIRAEIHRAGFTTLLETAEDLDGLADSIRSLSVGQVDGLICCFLDDESLIARLRSTLPARTPLVALSWHRPSEDVCTIELDVRSGMRSVTEHLLSLGHRTFAYVGGPAHSTVSQQKHAGFLEAIESAGIPPESVRLARVTIGVEAAQAAAAALLGTGTAPGTAFVCENDVLAVGALRACRLYGMKVPADVSITGFDDVPLATLVEPPLTTVSLPIRDMGLRAARRLLELAGTQAGAEPAPAPAGCPEDVFATSLVVRGSSGPA